MADWKVGDLALCVDAGPLRDVCGDGGQETNPKYVANLKKGAFYTVTQVVVCNCGRGHVGIGDEYQLAGGYAARFIKITPEKADDFDRETIELMNRKTVGETAA